MNSVSRFTKLLLPAVVAMFYMPTSAHALFISTSVGDYEVSAVEIDYASFEDTLMSQVWWGNLSLAEEFAALTNTAFGTPNFGHYAPFFWYTDNDTVGYCGRIGQSYAGIFWFNGTTNSVCTGSQPSQTYTWAVAEAVSVPEPNTLALFTLGLAGVGFAGLKRPVSATANA